MYNFKAIFGANSKLLNLNQEHPSKKKVFLVKSSQNCSYDNFSHKNALSNELSNELSNFGHMTTLQHFCHEMKFFGDLIDRNYGFIVFSKYLYFKKVGSIAGIVKIVTMSIKATFKM